jgi:hypothetical protein
VLSGNYSESKYIDTSSTCNIKLLSIALVGWIPAGDELAK